MLAPLGLLIFCAAVIYVSCELFVNGVEWLGHRLHMGATAVGTVLAAFGTALPESAITLIAVLFGQDGATQDIGVGAAMGGPLVLATLAYGVVGVCLVHKYGRGSARRIVDADNSKLTTDQLVFMATFTVKVALGYCAFAYKPYCALLFLAVYAAYLWHELRREEADVSTQGLERLRFAPRHVRPPLPHILTQVGLSVATITWAAQLFVGQLAVLGALWHLPPHVVALVLSPVATELPEILNACIWVRQGKERLALANISGSMMIQATIPSALGIAFTPWIFDGVLWVAAWVTLAAMALLCGTLWRGHLTARHLLYCPPLYLLFAGYLLITTWAS